MDAFNSGIALSQLSNSSKILAYFRFAADHSSRFGPINYGVYLLTIGDAPKEQAAAARYLKAAADRDDIQSIFNYTLCLFNGNGISSDPPEVVRLFKNVAISYAAR
jgi:TPR repeat protein